MAAVFVLQWLLQVPAHTAAHAAAAGPWAVPDPGALTFSLGGALVPDTVRLPALAADDRPMDQRLDAAETTYRAVAEPLAEHYDAPVRLGPHVRAGLVTDMWAAARREAQAAAGTLDTGPATRRSCCLIYALPGCTECAGCPRLHRAPGR